MTGPDEPLCDGTTNVTSHSSHKKLSCSISLCVGSTPSPTALRPIDCLNAPTHRAIKPAAAGRPFHAVGVNYPPLLETRTPLLRTPSFPTCCVVRLAEQDIALPAIGL